LTGVDKSINQHGVEASKTREQHRQGRVVIGIARRTASCLAAPALEDKREELPLGFYVIFSIEVCAVVACRPHSPHLSAIDTCIAIDIWGW
jgi:hypothetical protein